MTPKCLKTFWTEDRAAISPLYAVGILALVAISGVGFDYGRMMALDSELQNAADQAALAAATQLNGGTDAMVRARNAATNTFATAASAYVNETRFANDQRNLPSGTTDPRPITSLTFRFFNGYGNDSVGTELTNDNQGAQAQVVEVTVNARRVYYALTPLVGAFNSGNVIGKAMAALESATCNVPPMMFCVPNVNGVADTSFPTAADIGKGMHLHMNANAADPWAPGNFGFLNINYTYPNGTNPNHTLGFNEAFNGCTGGQIETQTGVRDPQADALNSRFDMYNQSMNNNACQAGTGNYCPAENVRRDWVNVQSPAGQYDLAEIAGLSCSSTASNNWVEVGSLPASPASGDEMAHPGALGFPKDNCFLTGNCTVVGNVGTSASTPNWNASDYMTKHHPGVDLATAAPNGTRFEVYKWEIANKGTALTSPTKVGYYATLKNSGKYDVQLYCAFPQPVVGTGVPASNTQKDRRLMTVAAVDCTNLHGSQPVTPLRWVDLFIVQPAEVNGSDKAFFVEIAGPARRAGGGSGFQYFGRKKAVLIR